MDSFPNLEELTLLDGWATVWIKYSFTASYLKEESSKQKEMDQGDDSDSPRPEPPEEQQIAAFEIEREKWYRSQAVLASAFCHWTLAEKIVTELMPDLGITLDVKYQGYVLELVAEKNGWKALEKVIRSRKVIFHHLLLENTVQRALHDGHYDFIKATVVDQSYIKVNCNLLITILARFCENEDWHSSAVGLIKALPKEIDIDKLRIVQENLNSLEVKDKPRVARLKYDLSRLIEDLSDITFTG